MLCKTFPFAMSVDIVDKMMFSRVRCIWLLIILNVLTRFELRIFMCQRLSAVYSVRSILILILVIVGGHIPIRNRGYLNEHRQNAFMISLWGMTFVELDHNVMIICCFCFFLWGHIFNLNLFRFDQSTLLRKEHGTSLAYIFLLGRDADPSQDYSFLLAE